MATVTPLVDEGLGNSTYLVDLGDGRAMVVDPSRDLRAVRTAAGKARVRLAYAAETHLHADFVSGAWQLAADGATVLAPAAGLRRYGHRGLAEGDEVDLGGLTLRTLATPGHTDEHLGYLLLDGSRPIGVFTGGSLLVGSAARTDLVDPGRAEELARAQYRSIQRLLELPDDVAVWPTHGAGSFCSAPPGRERVSTIGREKTTNPLLYAAGGPTDEDTFVARLLAGLSSYPAYFGRLAELNRLGPTLLPEPVRLPPLSVDEVRSAIVSGAVLVDVRPIGDFGAGHVPGSLADPLRPQFATWLGWLVPLETPLIFVRGAGQDPVEIAVQARKIGFEHLLGVLDGGIAAWTAAGRPLGNIPVLDAACAASYDAALLDVRQHAEYAAGHLPAAMHVELGVLADRDTARDLAPGRPLLTACGHGERAMTAASLLAAAGREVSVFAGAPTELAAARGQHLATGEPLETSPAPRAGR